ncbi:MAG: rod-binding protein, partial [Gammaproteobacteria bacterium]|nr:rod-binding protein [Gammaproteobacteria bacterium]
MTADIHASMIATDFNQLASLRAEAANQSPGTLRKAAQQFESLFAQMLIKNMRATSLGDGVFDSDQSRFYRDLFDQQIAVELSSNGSLGIADLMVRQLGGPAAHENRIETKPIAADAREFAEAVWPHIQKAARELN